MIKRAWKEFTSGKSIELYISIALAATVFVLDVIGAVPLDITTNVILLLMGLVALGRITDRWIMEDLRSELTKPEFITWENYTEEVGTKLQTARKVNVLGVAPLRFVRQYRDELLAICVREGVLICFVEPESTGR